MSIEKSNNYNTILKYAFRSVIDYEFNYLCGLNKKFFNIPVISLLSRLFEIPSRCFFSSLGSCASFFIHSMILSFSLGPLYSKTLPFLKSLKAGHPPIWYWSANSFSWVPSTFANGMPHPFSSTAAPSYSIENKSKNLIDYLYENLVIHRLECKQFKILLRNNYLASLVCNACTMVHTTWLKQYPCFWPKMWNFRSLILRLEMEVVSNLDHSFSTCIQLWHQLCVHLCNLRPGEKIRIEL